MSLRNAAFYRLILTLLLSLMAEAMAHAASPDKDEPIRIDARSVEASDKTGAMVYSGNVRVEQGRLSIQADRVEIMTRQGRTELVRATGKPAKLRQHGRLEVLQNLGHNRTRLLCSRMCRLNGTRFDTETTMASLGTVRVINITSSRLPGLWS